VGRRWAAVVAILTAIAILGCEKGQLSSSPDAPDATCAPRPVSVSLVNSWPLLDAEVYASDEERACASLVYYEMFPWVDRSGLCDQAHPTGCTDAYRTERKAHLHAMSAHKIITAWSPENFNAYGPKQWTDEEFREELRDFRRDAEEVGIEWVMMTTGGEPWAWSYNRARARAEIVREEWAGTLIMADSGANEASGRPYFSGIPYDFLEVHPCSIPQALRALNHSGPILTVTDCSPVLVPGEPVRSDLEAKAIQLGVPLLLYGFTDVALPEKPTS
jgi:hypothetical protein